MLASIVLYYLIYNPNHYEFFQTVLLHGSYESRTTNYHWVIEIRNSLLDMPEVTYSQVCFSFCGRIKTFIARRPQRAPIIKHLNIVFNRLLSPIDLYISCWRFPIFPLIFKCGKRIRFLSLLLYPFKSLQALIFQGFWRFFHFCCHAGNLRIFP